MRIDPSVFERFVSDFGLNMLNTLTSNQHRNTAHRRRIFVFDERGGVFGGTESCVEGYQNLTTGVFHSKHRQIVGVRYRCKPNDLSVPTIGAFHTHPALFSSNPRIVKRRIEQLLWLSEMDRLAFLKQNQLYGFQWHFIGVLDIGCFHIDDVRKGEMGPREVLQHSDLPGLIERLAPQILHYDKLLQSQSQIARSVERGVLEEIFRQAGDGGIEESLKKAVPALLPELARRVAQECQLLGFSPKQVNRTIRQACKKESPEVLGDFQAWIEGSYRNLSALTCGNAPSRKGCGSGE